MELSRIMYYTFVVWTVWEKVFFRMAMEVFIFFSRFAFTYRKEKESLPYFPQSISHLQIIYHKSFSISLLTCLHAWLRRIFIHTLFRFRSKLPDPFTHAPIRVPEPAFKSRTMLMELSSFMVNVRK